MRPALTNGRITPPHSYHEAFTIMCSHAFHVALKADHDRLRAECEYVGLSDYGFSLLELYNCVCRSTLSIPGIGPLQYTGDD
jgi:hypothetical protein